jgi:5,10-methylenetetrahydromethanopterin reductase
MTAEFWRMGATPVPSVDIGRFAREFEEDGWDGLAVGEAHGLLPDPYAVLAAAAAATTTLRVGTAVAVPLRDPLLAASAMATLHALSGGRAAFSVGRGDGAMKVLHRGPQRLTEFETYLARLQAYLRREPVEIDGAVTSLARIDDLDPSLGLPKPPVDVAATGPRTIDVAARLADGVSFSFGADLPRLARAIDAVRESCAAAGRDPSELAIGCYVQVAVGGGDALEAIRGLVVTHARFSAFEGSPAPEASARKAVETMEPVYASARGGVTRTAGGKPGEIDFYPPEAGAGDLVERFAITGPPARCAARLREIVGLGVTRVYIGTRAVGVDLEEENSRRIAREVLPLLR